LLDEKNRQNHISIYKDGHNKKISEELPITLYNLLNFANQYSWSNQIDKKIGHNKQMWNNV